MTQVTFKRADVEAELERRIAEKVKARTAELEAKVAAMQQQMDAELPKLADGLIAARILKRRDLRTLDAIERNDANVVVETKDVLFLGDDAFVTFEIENRNKAPYRVADRRDARRHPGHRRRRPLHQRRRRDRRRRRRRRRPPRWPRPGRRRRPPRRRPRRQALTLVIAEPGGRGKVAVDRIVLR
jgi:hypothetical protein